MSPLVIWGVIWHLTHIVPDTSKWRPALERFQSNWRFIKVPRTGSGEINSDRVKGLYHNPVCKHAINSISCALWVIKWEKLKLLKDLWVQLLRWGIIQIAKDPLSCVSEPQSLLLLLFNCFCLQPAAGWLHLSDRTRSSTWRNRKVVCVGSFPHHNGHNLDLHRRLSRMWTATNDTILCQNN